MDSNFWLLIISYLDHLVDDVGFSTDFRRRSESFLIILIHFLPKLNSDSLLFFFILMERGVRAFRDPTRVAELSLEGLL